MTNKMNRVKFFYADYQSDLQSQVSDFIRDVEVITISYSTSPIGYIIKHYCCVVYR